MPHNTKLRDLMQELVRQTADKGILWAEAEAQFEKQFIQYSLSVNGWNLQKTAKSMGIHRNTLARKVALYRISRRPSAP